MAEYTSPIPYPWQQPHWHTLLKQVEQNRLPHALLLSGQKGVGKWHYAKAMADYLLCLTPRSGLSCGQCRSCQLIQSETHPDKIIVIPEDNAKQIKVDQVRKLSEQISSTSQQGGNKVIVLGPVEQLNMNAANALLKNLEEPTSNTFFILFTHVSSGVIATIKSRCQLLPMPAPNKTESIKWLQDLGLNENTDAVLDIAAGAPLIARSLLEQGELSDHLNRFLSGLLKVQIGDIHSPPELSIVAEWLDIDLGQLFEWWIQLLYSSIQQIHGVASSPSSEGQLINSLIQINDLLKRCNQQWMFRFIDKLLLSKDQWLRGANPNKQLLLEELLLDWYAIIKSSQSKLKSAV